MEAADRLYQAAVDSGLKWGRPDGVLVSREAVVDAARSWLGTPFKHQGEIKGVGIDCGGMIRGVSIELGLIPKDYRTRVRAELLRYPRRPMADLGLRLASHFWQEIPIIRAKPGDVLLFRWKSSPVQHSGFVTPYPAGLGIVHALGPLPPGRVVENLLDKTWRSRIAAAYHLPGVER